MLRQGEEKAHSVHYKASILNLGGLLYYDIYVAGVSHNNFFALCRTSEYENFLSLLLLPEQSRPAAIAIRAFNIELAQVWIIYNHLKCTCGEI